ncbi:MAG: fructose-1,6-bisphosphatase [Lachnospiraceae bacterium]|nr:fructose-1,6-bisphosphatase [Lachnospiraceae bacterium]
MTFDERELEYLRLLAREFPTIAAASTEIINLQSIMNLPKGTEHFLTDIHGEYEQFNHVLKNGSGSVRRKIDEEFGNTMSRKDKKSLATLIYYPKEKLEIIQQEEDNIEDWYKITLHRLVQMTKRVASKYTRSKVRRALPRDFAYVIEELITEKEEVQDKEEYYNSIINTIIEIGRAQELIIALSNLVQRLVIDHLHIVGDIFDRGPGPHIIMDTLMNYHSLDIQWGNHDIIWMGAAAGHWASIATVVRMSTRYGTMDALEEGYGINMIPLVSFAMNVYGENDCSAFTVNISRDREPVEYEMNTRMHKAMFIIQQKLEGQMIKKHPEFEMDSRLLLDKIDFDKKTVTINGTEYPIKDCDFPTVDRNDPYKLTEDEFLLMKRLDHAFRHSEKLQRHVRFLHVKGSLYKVFNSNLLYHGCVPMNEDGSFRSMVVDGNSYSGRALYDILESFARKGYYSKDPAERMKGQDYTWYLWTGPNSPVFGKDKMATFERYLVEDASTHKEVKNPYYSLRDNRAVIDSILEEFGLGEEGSHIINGHVPVELKKGESPIMCDGRLLIIDGGFSKAYQSKTGIAGYTLVSNSHGLRIVAHEPFESTHMAIINETDIVSDEVIVETNLKRTKVADTDTGKELKKQISQLQKLLKAYEEGIIVEK